MKISYDDVRFTSISLHKMEICRHVDTKIRTSCQLKSVEATGSYKKVAGIKGLVVFLIELPIIQDLSDRSSNVPFLTPINAESSKK